MVKHHPNENLLAEYAAGSLPFGLSIGVSAHLHFCSRCRHRLESLNDLGGTLLADTQAVPVAADLLDSVMARLDTPVQQQPKPANRFNLPQVLEKLVPDLKSLRWRRLSPSLRVSRLQAGQDRYEVALHKISRGGKVAEHDHRGQEVTVVLKGSFSDDEGVYTPGDFLLREPGDVHRPRATQNQDCLCLSVVEAPVLLTGWFNRWLNPLLSFKPG
ncbi:transcriptional regulator [Exilibacterium tricleocarpae]|uniref:Transcriptional regulator n=1 Tax=Exilibacterium tricleocarpae TaxID=2591008 RepID=A0A545TS80_9GAMM|nr:ChrR family anti-sigma-E factor [Exilibacterium tricleocarpae]TQV80069.1 transcriptional regulator [Exilibacterium tricleocarpae]